MSVRDSMGQASGTRDGGKQCRLAGAPSLSQRRDKPSSKRYLDSSKENSEQTSLPFTVYK